MTNPAGTPIERRSNSPRRVGRRLDGFTLIELLIATTLILMAMGALMLVFTSALAQTAGAKQRQVADSLLTKTMEQLRALPYATIAKGLDTTASAGDTANIQYVSASVWKNIPTGEDIPHGNLGYIQTPLNVPPSTGNLGHEQQVTVNNTVYTLRVYPTFYNGVTGSTTQPVYRVTVFLSWTTNAKLVKVSGQTLVYSPQGCLSTATHPFGAPCQPFFYATAETGLGAIQVAPADAAVDGVSGIDLQQAQLLLPEEHATMDVEQISKVLAKGVTSGGTLDLNSGSTTTAGGVGAAPQADTDPASLASPFASSVLTQITGTLFASDNNGANANWIQVRSSNADTGTATATASASASPACTTLTAVTITNALPCASVDVQQVGTTAALGTSTIQIGVHSGSTDWGATPLASIGPAPGKTRLFTSRSTTGGGASCTATSGNGCVHAGAIRRLGTIRLGGLPAKVLTDGAAPAAWSPNNYLIELTNFADEVHAESGISPAAPTTQRLAASGVGTPILRYWIPSLGAYSAPITWATAPSTVTIPAFTVTDTSGSGSLNVTMSGTITFGALQTDTVLPSGCSTLCTARATAQSPINADITYTITSGGSTLAHLNISVDLANLEVTTKYRAAPVAS